MLVKNNKGKEVDKGWTCDLVPKALIVARYFAAEQETITILEAELEGILAQMTEIEEEHGGEEGAFSEAKTEAPEGKEGKVTRAKVIERLKDIKGDKEVEDEAEVLNDWLKLNNQESDLKKRLKEADAALDATAYAQYPKLTESEIKTLVVEDKWMASLDAAIHGEVDRISQALTQRVKELAERYETPLPNQANRVTKLGQVVHRHLERMGFTL